jgi:hypothetical protein
MTFTPKGNVPSQSALESSHAVAEPFPQDHFGSVAFVRLSLPSQGGEKLPFLGSGNGLSTHMLMVGRGRGDGTAQTERRIQKVYGSGHVSECHPSPLTYLLAGNVPVVR